MESTAFISSSNALPTAAEVINSDDAKTASEGPDTVVANNKALATSLEADVAETKTTDELEADKVFVEGAEIAVMKLDDIVVSKNSSSDGVATPFGDVVQDVYGSEMDLSADRKLPAPLTIVESTDVNFSSTVLPTVAAVVNSKDVKSALKALDAVVVSYESMVPSAPSLESEVGELNITDDLDADKVSSGVVDIAALKVDDAVHLKAPLSADIVDMQSGSVAITGLESESSESTNYEMTALEDGAINSDDKDTGKDAEHAEDK